MEEVLDVSEHRQNRERGPSALERVETLCESLSISLPTAVDELQIRIEGATWLLMTIPDYRLL